MLRKELQYASTQRLTCEMSIFLRDDPNNKSNNLLNHPAATVTNLTFSIYLLVDITTVVALLMALWHM